MEEYNKWNEKFPRQNHSRLEDAEEPISNLEDRVMENPQAEQQKEERILKVRTG